MSKQIRRRVWSAIVVLAMATPLVLVVPAHSQSSDSSTTTSSGSSSSGGSNQTGTDPEPIDPGVVTQAILLAMAIE
jgi:hypothetical protein